MSVPSYRVMLQLPPLCSLFSHELLEKEIDEIARNTGGDQTGYDVKSSFSDFHDNVFTVRAGTVLAPPTHLQDHTRPTRVYLRDRKSTRLNSSHGYISY